MRRCKNCLRVLLNAEHRLSELADLARVDVDVDDLGVRAELAELAGCAVVEASADREQQVAFAEHEVRVRRTVHAEHAEVASIARVECAEAHQRARHREVLALGERGDELVRTGLDHATADVQHGALARLRATR